MSKKIFTTLLLFFAFLHLDLFAVTINLDKAALETKTTDKAPLVYLHRTGCPYCERLEEFTLDDEDVHNYIENNFNFIVINVSFTQDVVIYKNEKMAPRDFAIKMGYNFFPSVLFLNHLGDLEHASVGYIEEKEFLLILQYMKTNSYKTMTIDQYKKKTGYKDEKNQLIDKRQKL